MIDFACPTSKELTLLKQHYRKTAGTVSQRAHCMLLSSSGKTPYDISLILFRGEKTIREWINLWHKVRLASLFSQNHLNHNASKLSPRQREEIVRVLASPPSEFGIPSKFWDVASLRYYLVANFGLVYESPRSYHFLFRINNFSFKLPAKFDVRRQDKEVAKRVKELRQIIAPFLTDPAWVVLAQDESRLVWEAIIRRCWLPKGRKSVLKVQRENIAQNFSGFLDLKTGKARLFPMPWQNQRETIKVLKRLVKSYSGKKICLIWDNAPWHKGKLIREQLKTRLNRFYLLAFPPYAPDTNPVEHIWKWGKDQLANTQFASMEELTKTFKKIITGRIYSYRI